MQDPTYPLVPVANLLAACLVVHSLVSSGLRGAYTRGVVILGAWILMGDLITAVQAIVWRNSYDVRIPVFCDICVYPRISAFP